MSDLCLTSTSLSRSIGKILWSCLSYVLSKEPRKQITTKPGQEQAQGRHLQKGLAFLPRAQVTHLLGMHRCVVVLQVHCLFPSGAHGTPPLCLGQNYKLRQSTASSERGWAPDPVERSLLGSSWGTCGSPTPIPGSAEIRRGRREVISPHIWMSDCNH